MGFDQASWLCSQDLTAMVFLACFSCQDCNFGPAYYCISVGSKAWKAVSIAEAEMNKSIDMLDRTKNGVAF